MNLALYDRGRQVSWVMSEYQEHDLNHSGDLRVGASTRSVASGARPSRRRARQCPAVQRAPRPARAARLAAFERRAMGRMAREGAPCSDEPDDADEQSAHQVRRPVDGEIESRIRVGEKHHHRDEEGPAPTALALFSRRSNDAFEPGRAASPPLKTVGMVLRLNAGKAVE